MNLKLKTKDSIAIKICGITKFSQAKAISLMGADAIGIIGVKGSPRFIDSGKRDEIFSKLKIFAKDIERVLVVADLNDSEFDSILKAKAAPSSIQLHGNESPERCFYLKSKYKDIKWWKAIRIKTEADIKLLRKYENKVDAILIDAWSSKSLGGTGSRVSLNLISKIKVNTPLWVAGGIDEDWIPKILSKIRPYGLDASSKLEISPGIKDLEKVKSLIETIRSLQ